MSFSLFGNGIRGPFFFLFLLLLCYIVVTGVAPSGLSTLYSMLNDCQLLTKSRTDSDGGGGSDDDAPMMTTKLFLLLLLLLFSFSSICFRSRRISSFCVEEEESRFWVSFQLSEYDFYLRGPSGRGMN